MTRQDAHHESSSSSSDEIEVDKFRKPRPVHKRAKKRKSEDNSAKKQHAQAEDSSVTSEEEEVDKIRKLTQTLDQKKSEGSSATRHDAHNEDSSSRSRGEGDEVRKSNKNRKSQPVLRRKEKEPASNSRTDDKDFEPPFARDLENDDDSDADIEFDSEQVLKTPKPDWKLLDPYDEFLSMELRALVAYFNNLPKPNQKEVKDLPT